MSPWELPWFDPEDEAELRTEGVAADTADDGEEAEQ